MCQCLGVDAAKQNESNTGRPVSVVDREAGADSRRSAPVIRVRNLWKPRGSDSLSGDALEALPLPGSAGNRRPRGCRGVDPAA